MTDSWWPTGRSDTVLFWNELKELNVSDIDIKLNVYYLCSKERWINPVMKEFIRMAKEL